MESRRVWLRGVQRWVASFTAVAMLALTGCATGATEVPPSASGADGDITDAETCAAIGDVLSTTLNADVAVGEGRMTAQEQGGWYRLASIVLDRVPIRGEGSVGAAAHALQASAPPVALAAAGRTAIGSDEWREGVTAVMQACEDAGSEIAVVAFTGG